MEAAASPRWAWCGEGIVAFSEARVPIEDRGLQFGESVYEVIAVVGGEPFRLPDHVDRMISGARAVGIDSGVPDLSKWKTIIAQLYRREPHRAAVLYAQLTGGTAPRRHLPPQRHPPFFFAYLCQYAFPVPAEIARGIAAVTVPDNRWQHRDIKTTMLLPAVLAKKAAASAGAEEAIFVGQDGYVNEGASSTVFAVRDRVVMTPPVTQRVLPGVSTKAVHALCEQLGIQTAWTERKRGCGPIRRTINVNTVWRTFMRTRLPFGRALSGFGPMTTDATAARGNVPKWNELSLARLGRVPRV